MSSGSQRLSLRTNSEAVNSGGVGAVKQTCWSNAWTPASVRLEPPTTSSGQRSMSRNRLRISPCTVLSVLWTCQPQ